MPAYAAVATVVTSTNASSYGGGGFTPLNKTLLVVSLILVSDCVERLPILTWNQTPVTGAGHEFVGQAKYRTSLDSLYCFVSSRPTNTAATTTDVSIAPTTGSGSVIDNATVSGMSKFGLASVRQFKVAENQAAASTPTVVFDKPCLADNPVLTAIGCGTNTPGTNAPVGFQVRRNTGYTVPTEGFTYATINSGFTSDTVAWTQTVATEYAVMALELDGSPLDAEDAPPLIAGWGGTR